MSSEPIWWFLHGFIVCLSSLLSTFQQFAKIPDWKVFETRNRWASHYIWLRIWRQFLHGICVHPLQLHEESKEDSMPQVWLFLILPEVWLIPSVDKIKLKNTDIPPCIKHQFSNYKQHIETYQKTIKCCYCSTHLRHI